MPEDNSEQKTLTANEPTALAPLTSDEEQKMILEARRNSGEGTKLNVKFVSFNGKDGHFYCNTNKKNEFGKTVKEDLGTEFKGVIVKSRCRVNVFNPKNPLATFRSEEFDNTQNEVIRIFNGNSQKVGEGTYKELKMKISGVTMEKVLYIKESNSDVIVKMSVGGTSIKPFFDYLKSFAQDDTSIRYVTVFNSADKTNEFGAFKTMTFVAGDKIDLRLALDYQRGLEMALNLFNRSNQTEVVSSSDEPQYVSVDEEFGAHSESDIKPEDVPF